MELKQRQVRIQKVLETLEPSELTITNESARHQGHLGDDGSGESHFRVHVVSDRFIGLSRVARERWVTDLLASEFKSGLHALTLILKTTTE